MRITLSSNREAFTTIAGYELGLGKAFLFRSKSILRRMQQIAGLTAVTLFRSYSLRSLIVYTQWKDRLAAETGSASAEYINCVALLGRNTFPDTLCDVTFVDDARPVSDDLNAVVLSPGKGAYVTLVGTFDVHPDRREELLNLLRRDHEFLRKFDGFVSVAFHRAIHRENVVVELLQFKSALKLRAVSKTPRGAAHLAAVDAVAKVSANIYRLSSGFERVR